MNSIRTITFFLIILACTLAVQGCKVIDKIESYNGVLDPKIPDMEIGLLQDAEYAFYAENYKEAENIYLEIKERSENEVYVSSASYGLACIRIISSKDTTELKENLDLLKNWKEQKGDSAVLGDDPGLMITALDAKKELLECVPEIRYVISKKSASIIKKQEKEISELKDTIKKLEHQISVLETIDQEIQEKRKPL